MERILMFLRKSTRVIGTAVIIALGAYSLYFSSSPLRTAEQDEQLYRNRIEEFFWSAPAWIENWLFELRSKHQFAHTNKSPNLVVIEISDKTLTEVGRWPWTRSTHAKVLNNLKAYGAKTVMLDMAFPEPEGVAPDDSFAKAINHFVEGGKGAVVIGYDITSTKSDGVATLPEEILFSVVDSQPPYYEIRGANQINKFSFVTPKLLQSEGTFGFMSASADTDGVFRQAKLAAGIQGNYLPSLGLAGFQHFYKNPEKKQNVLLTFHQEDGLQLKITSELSTTFVPLSTAGEMRVRFFGYKQNFVTVPLEEIFFDPNPSENEKLKAIFQNKAALIGSSAFGAHDLRHTPLAEATPGMFIHANVFHSLSQSYFYHSENQSIVYSWGLFLLSVLGALLLLWWGNLWAETLGTFALIATPALLDRLYFIPEGYFIRLFSVSFPVLAVYSWNTLLNVFREAQEKQKIRATFQRYVAPAVVKEMLAHPEKLQVGGEKKEITMLFSDVRDFTTISEKLSPTDLALLLKIYMGQMTDFLFETQGTLDKYIGDALVGFWGAPLDIPDHANKALQGAMKMINALPAINRDFASRNFPQINVGIGLNTGEVSVGNMGSDKLFQYTALGDHMNLASRLEGLTKYYGVNVLISEYTYEKLGAQKSDFVLRPVDNVKVKGKSKAVKIYEAVPGWSALFHDSSGLQSYKDAYNLCFTKREFSGALEIIADLLNKYPDDKPIAHLRKTCELYAAIPPEDGWDGSTTFTTK